MWAVVLDEPAGCGEHGVDLLAGFLFWGQGCHVSHRFQNPTLFCMSPAARVRAAGEKDVGILERGELAVQR